MPNIDIRSFLVPSEVERETRLLDTTIFKQFPYEEWTFDIIIIVRNKTKNAILETEHSTVLISHREPSKLLHTIFLIWSEADRVDRFITSRV